MELAKPSYGLDNTPVDLFAPSPKAPGFLNEAAANWRLGFTPQVAEDAWNSFYPDEEGYDPWSDFGGYEMFADRLVLARSPAQMQAMKRQIDRNMADRELLARGEWGIIAGLVGGVFDPINLVPIPGATGIGFVRGALRAGASNVAITAATEPFRIAADPTAEWSEMQYSLGMAGLLGAGLGGMAGAFRARGVRAARSGRPAATFDDLWRAASEDEGDNLARTFSAQDEDISREFGFTDRRDASGRYEPVVFETIDVPIATKQGPDGETYRFDPTLGWVNDAAPDRPVGDDVRDVLGQPEMVKQERLIVDDTTLKHDYERGKWVDDLPEEMRPEASRLIRNKDEYLDFRQLEAVWRGRLKPMDGESPDAFRARAQTQAMNELQGRRVSSSVARSNIIGRIAEVANRSPVANAIRKFTKDTLLTDLPLQIAGDGGWMTQANRAGIATKPSVLLQTLRHQKAISDLRSVLDAAWLKLVTKNKDIKGYTFAGQNMSAALSQAQASVRGAFGANVLTPQDFREMVGRAIFEADDFEINGFKVLPEAREAAEMVSKVFREYDEIQRDLGLYHDQKGLKRTVQESDRRIVDLKGKMARWLWSSAKPIPGTNKPRPAPKEGMVRLYRGLDKKARGADTAMFTTDLDAASKVGEVFFIDVPEVDAKSLLRGTDQYELSPDLVKRSRRFLRPEFEVTVRDRPQRLQAAIRVGERVYTGETYEEAITALLDQFGADGRALLEKLTPEDYGWTVTAAEKAPEGPFGGVPLTTKLVTEDNNPLPLYHGTRKWFSRFAKDKRGSNTGDLDAFDGVFFATNPEFAKGFSGEGDAGRVVEAFGNAERPVEYLPSEYGGYFDGQRWKDLLDEARREGNDAVIFKDFEFEGGKSDIVVLLDEDNVHVSGQSFVGLTPEEGSFRSFDEVTANRVDALSESQRVVYDDMAGQLSRIEQERAAASTALENLTEQPHVFLDQKGRAEGYFSRWFNETEISARRPAFERLITAIFSRDNPLGAAERAKSFVDDMLGTGDIADEGPPMGGGVRHLHERKLKVGNSFKIVDPELGEIKLADFIENDVEVIFDTYIRRAGARIEMARQFGDPDMWGALHDAEVHWRDKFIKDGMSPDEIKAARANFDEWKGWVELTRDDVLGRLKTRPTWALDNRIAKHFREIGQMTRLGKVIKTVLPELARPGMVNGFGTAFKATLLRWFATIEQLDRNAENMRLTAEILDMNMPHAAARLNELNTADVRRGTAYERFISRQVPTFFKLNGLTPYTVTAKNISMTAAQHRIMSDAIAIADALNNGRQPDAAMVDRNAADGISLRDNLLLAKMPYEMSGNELILPATDKWTGSEGRRARNLLVNSLQINSRRTIITPGPADLPLIARGVFAWKGEKKFESDLLGLLFMFKGYGMAATQKLVLSGVQGRDVSFASGILAMLMLGALATYWKTPTNAWRNKSYEDILIESYENAGIGGFIFSDINSMVETYSGQKLGVRPMLGLDPKFVHESPVSKYIDMLGPGASVYPSMVQAFLDPDLSTSNAAQLFRRQLPYATLYQIDSLTRDLTSAGAAAFEE